MSSIGKGGVTRSHADGGVCCRRCEENALVAIPTSDIRARLMRMRRTMILCSTCGNKRCPRATDHELACTGSNEPGQPGSVY